MRRLCNKSLLVRLTHSRLQVDRFIATRVAYHLTPETEPPAQVHCVPLWLGSCAVSVIIPLASRALLGFICQCSGWFSGPIRGVGRPPEHFWGSFVSVRCCFRGRSGRSGGLQSSSVVYLSVFGVVFGADQGGRGASRALLGFSCQCSGWFSGPIRGVGRPPGHFWCSFVSVRVGFRGRSGGSGGLQGTFVGDRFIVTLVMHHWFSKQSCRPNFTLYHCGLGSCAVSGITRFRRGPNVL